MIALVRVRFIRAGERRYRVEVDRGDGPIMHMPHGPGFDPWLPHDLVHCVVERHLGIAGGVFGQLAAGGDAGTFFTIPHRRRDPARRRSERLGMLGREDMARSERLAAACTAAWYAQRGRRWAPAGAVEPGEPEAVPASLLSELEQVATRWHALQVGGTLALDWPDELRARSRPAPAAKPDPAASSASRAHRRRRRHPSVPGA
jgi:hypothetical protein